jgi:allantoin racemase
VVACFGDPGRDEARAMLPAPVLGIAQAAMHAAALAAGTFSVVTSMSATISRAWQLAKVYTPNQCLGVYACDIPVLQIDSDPDSIDRSAISAPPHSSRTAAARSRWHVRRWRRSPRP